MKTKIITVLAVLFTITFQAQAAYVLTFDDISLSDSGLIPNGYGVLDWEDFYYINVTANEYKNFGYYNGIVSGEYVAITSDYSTPGNGRITNDLFTFNGVYLTAAYRDGLDIQVDGYLNDVLLYSTTVVVDTTGPTWFDFDYIDIDALSFSSFGGTPHAGYPDNGTYFAMDNFTYIPEPTTLLLFGIGIVFLRKRHSLKN